MNWKEKLINYVINELKSDKDWKFVIDDLKTNIIALHLAIFNEPFLSLVYSGDKKLESRFSVNKISPFNKVSEGDIIILKGSGKPITGLYVAGKVKYLSELNVKKFKELEVNYSIPICSSCDPKFWESRQKMKYATFIEIKKIKKIKPFVTKKNDRLAWSVLKQRLPSPLFSEITQNHKTAIILSGKIASGKSTVAEILSKKYNFPIISFGNYLKNYCLSNNLSITRETLQNQGEKLIQEDPRKFLLDVINCSKKKSDIIILDGVRHKVIVDVANNIFKKVIVVYVEADLGTRSLRYLKRKKSTDNVNDHKNLIVIDNHPVEFEIDILKDLSDIIVDSSKNYEKYLLDVISLKLQSEVL